MSELWLPLLLFAVAGSLTPGPNNIMLAASGVNYGFRRTVPHMIGICIGFPLMFLAVGLGLSRVFEEAPVIHTAQSHGKRLPALVGVARCDG
jgi:threonine/homoserine/homoserine lactone efflux protein